jgi:enamine deaminase RidA (YjgF/YER057c/UK114 family)
MKRVNISSGTKWEPMMGFSRAVRVGTHIFVSGTTATDESGQLVGIGNPYMQTKKAIENIEKALAKLGASLKDVVRTRLFVKDLNHWDEVAKAHVEFFGEIKPATSFIEVSRLVDTAMLVSVEADAVIDIKEDK